MKVLLAALALVAMTAQAHAAVTLYTASEQAAKHCKSPVVWLNTKTGIYHFAGSKDYGATKDGAYVCQKSADKAGDRPAANGQ